MKLVRKQPHHGYTVCLFQSQFSCNEWVEGTCANKHGSPVSQETTKLSWGDQGEAFRPLQAFHHPQTLWTGRSSLPVSLCCYRAERKNRRRRSHQSCFSGVQTEGHSVLELILLKHRKWLQPCMSWAWKTLHKGGQDTKQVSSTALLPPSSEEHLSSSWY